MINEDKKKLVTIDSQKLKINLSLLDQEIQNFADALIVLNCKEQKQWLDIGVKIASIILLADGGSNHFYQSSHRDNQKIKLIVGDFDSIKPDVKKYYQEKKIVRVQEYEDQDLNDFQKCILKGSQLGCKSFICLGALGGRMDHTLSAMHIATKYGRKANDIDLILIGAGNMMIYIRANTETVIKISEKVAKKGCGLVPLNKIQKIQTSGFKWNLGQKQFYSSLEWGNFISTSNQIVAEQVEILSSSELFFVCQLKK